MEPLRSFLMLVLLLVMSEPLRGQSAAEIRPPVPDPRVKVDALLVVAHPDDETAIGGYLAKIVLDEQRRIAVVYCNRGTGGGNSTGTEQSTSMGLIREIEARRALAAYGVDLAWFLNGRDTPGQDVFQSLQSWGHGATLEAVVRIVRLTRPEVILTWLPHYVAGENHGDHQASGVIATEAFDVAGDPTAYPAQVAPPRERGDINQWNEGLTAWQPKKLYFFSDASHDVAGDGPSFDLSEISPSRNVPYYRLAAELHRPHLTQGDVSEPALEAEKSGDYKAFREWLGRFGLLFGKSVVACNPRGDLFEGVTPAPHVFVHPPASPPADLPGVSFRLGGVFSYYREFWAAHGIEHVGPLVTPEVEVAGGTYLHIPLEVSNATADSVLVSLTPVVPEGWKVAQGEGTYRIPAGTVVPVQTFVQCPAEPTPAPKDVVWRAAIGGRSVGSVVMKVKLVEWALPQ